MTDAIDAPTPPESLPKYLADGLPKQDVEIFEDVRERVATADGGVNVLSLDETDSIIFD